MLFTYLYLFFFYILLLLSFFFFFFNDTATTEIYTLSLHDALPIYRDRLDGIIVTLPNFGEERAIADALRWADLRVPVLIDRKSTRLNSSHLVISYAVFCLKKKKKIKTIKLVQQQTGTVLCNAGRLL